MTSVCKSQEMNIFWRRSIEARLHYQIKSIPYPYFLSVPVFRILNFFAWWDPDPYIFIRTLILQSTLQVKSMIKTLFLFSIVLWLFTQLAIFKGWWKIVYSFLATEEVQKEPGMVGSGFRCKEMTKNLPWCTIHDTSSFWNEYGIASVGVSVLGFDSLQKRHRTTARNLTHFYNYRNYDNKFQRKKAGRNIVPKLFFQPNKPTEVF